MAAIARKLTVAIWYLMSGRFSALQELDQRLKIKVGKIISAVSKSALKQIGKTHRQLREEMEQSLKSARIYVLDPDKRLSPAQTSTTQCA